MSDAPWRLGGRFDLLGPLGTGAAGTVWRGREVSDGTEHAVKLLRSELVSDGAAVTQLYATLNSIAQLAHPGIAAVDDAVSADGWLALRSRLIRGESLRTLLSRQAAMPPAQAAALIAHVCDTLAAAHAAGIAHGDLHPANVLLGAPSPAAPTDATITDFGMAALVNRAAAQGVPAASAAHAAPPAEYRAPELNPAQSDSAPADVYAVGVILYECLAGRPPFIAQWPDVVAQMHRQTPPAPIAGITDALWRIVDACLQKDPRYRPTAAQLAVALRNEATAASGVAQTMVFSAYPGDIAQDQPQPRTTAALAASAATPAANFRLPRVITDHKTESGIAAAVLVVGLLIGVALSMAGGGTNGSSNGSPNAANAGQATSAPSAATTSATPQAVVAAVREPVPVALRVALAKRIGTSHRQRGLRQRAEQQVHGHRRSAVRQRHDRGHLRLQRDSSASPHRHRIRAANPGRRRVLPRRLRLRQHARREGRHMELQRRQQPAVDAAARRFDRQQLRQPLP